MFNDTSMTHDTVAIILAGGSGKRMGNPIPKQLREIKGIPVIVRSLQAFQECKEVRSIIVVSREDDIPTICDLCKTYNISKLKKIVPGGKTRLLSAYMGFEAIESRENLIAIHDAARCLITSEQISEIIEKAGAYGAAIAACSEKDTIKQVNEKGVIVSTIDRNNIYHAQTPQIFERRVYENALYKAIKNDIEITDDAQMVELCGDKVMVVDCGPDIFKITYERDMIVAELVLERRQNKESIK